MTLKDMQLHHFENPFFRQVLIRQFCRQVPPVPIVSVVRKRASTSLVCNICYKCSNNNCFAILAAKPYICEDEPRRL